MSRYRQLICALLLLPLPLLAANLDTPDKAAPRLHPQSMDAQSRWALRLGLFSEREEASRMVDTLSRLGQRARIQATQCAGQPIMYHVVIGGFDDSREAESANIRRDLPGFSMRLVRVADSAADITAQLDPDDCPRPKLPPRNPDDELPKDGRDITLFDRPIHIGGLYTLSSRIWSDRDLYGGDEDDEWSSKNKLKAEILYEFAEDASLYVEFSGSYSRDLYHESGEPDTSSEFEREEMWLYWRDIGASDVSVQVGRINLQETREWWWDEDLDAVRIHYEKGEFEYNFVLAQELARVSNRDQMIDPEKDQVMRLIQNWDWEYVDDHKLAFFSLLHLDRSNTERRGDVIDIEREDVKDKFAVWLGARLIGRWKFDDWGRLYYWADYAALHGREIDLDSDGDFEDDNPGLIRIDDRDEYDLKSWAYDLGLIWQTPWLRKSWLALGYARGSGDRDGGEHRGDGIDRNFQQTGLQDNSQRLRGLARFNYYGEAFRPELSNMSILTVAAGWEFAEDTSVDLVWHDYRQVVLSDSLRDAGLNGDADEPNGLDPHLGQEIDIIFGREWPNLDLDIALGYFQAGKGLRSAELDESRAWTLSFEAEYSF